MFTFLRSLATRQNFAHLGFMGGIAAFAFGAEQLGQTLNIGGLGAICGGLALLMYAYLLGAE